MRKPFLAASLCAVVALGGCASTSGDITAKVKALCAEAVPLANLAKLYPPAAPVAEYVIAACSTVDGQAKLAADPSSPEWLAMLIGELSALVPSK